MRSCPVCRAEYPAGTVRCPECDLEVVDSLEEGPLDELPAEETPPGNLVTIAALDTPTKASILASELEAHGIECFIADAETVAMHGLLTGAVGGVKVQVRESDAAKAAEVARRQIAAMRVVSRPCPSCGGTNAHRQGLSILMAILVVMTLGILALAFPVKWKCPDCGNEWH